MVRLDVFNVPHGMFDQTGNLIMGTSFQPIYNPNECTGCLYLWVQTSLASILHNRREKPGFSIKNPGLSVEKPGFSMKKTQVYRSRNMVFRK